MLENKKIAILIEDMFNVFEFWYPYYRLKEAGAEVVVVGSGRTDVFTGKPATELPDMDTDLILPDSETPYKAALGDEDTKGAFCRHVTIGRGATFSFLWRRATLAIRGLGYTTRSEAEISARDLGRLDTMYATTPYRPTAARTTARPAKRPKSTR